MSTLPVRMVCISNTFGETPKLPPGDILIHAGNLTNNGSLEELQRTVSWLDQSDFKIKLIVAGDRDKCLDASTTRPASSHECPSPLKDAATVIYLNHEAKTIKFRTNASPEVRLKVFGSPFSRQRPHSAFGLTLNEAYDVWSEIPLDTDIRGFTRCRPLREALWRVRPRMVVSGREYAGRGVEVVGWELSDTFVKYREVYTYRFKPPPVTTFAAKQNRYDLSSTSVRSLKNDGTPGKLVPFHRQAYLKPTEANTDDLPDHELKLRRTVSDVEQPQAHNKILPLARPINQMRRRTTLGVGLGLGNGIDVHASTSICDIESILGREGRRETAFVNGAYLPHDRDPALHNLYKDNRAIIVDIEMPIAESTDKWYIKEVLQSGPLLDRTEPYTQVHCI